MPLIKTGTYIIDPDHPAPPGSPETFIYETMADYVEINTPLVFKLTTKFVDISKGGKVLWYSDEKGTKEVSPPKNVSTSVHSIFTPVTVTFRLTKDEDNYGEWLYFFRVKIDETVSHNVGCVMLPHVVIIR